MQSVVSVRHVESYTLEVAFSDGMCRLVDMKDELYGDVFEPLKDVERFKRVSVDPEIGTIVWDTGADVCPTVLYQMGTALVLPGAREIFIGCQP